MKKYYEVNNCARKQNGMPRRQQHALDDEQRKLCDMLIQMGMDAGVAWERDERSSGMLLAGWLRMVQGQIGTLCYTLVYSFR